MLFPLNCSKSISRAARQILQLCTSQRLSLEKSLSCWTLVNAWRAISVLVFYQLFTLLLTRWLETLAYQKKHSHPQPDVLRTLSMATPPPSPTSQDTSDTTMTQ